MDKVYIVEELTTNHDYEQYDHVVCFVTDDIQFAKNKIKSLIKEKIDAFNINTDAIGSSDTIRQLNDNSYIIDHKYTQELVEYEITEWKVL